MPKARADERSLAVGEHIITVHDDGQSKGFITKKQTLREALAEAAIKLDRNDRTEPNIDERLVANSYNVNIYRARTVVVKDGSQLTKIITSYRTGKQIVKQAGIAVRDEDILTLSQSNSPMRDSAAEVLSIKRATPFNFDFYGKKTISYTQAKTVGEMLAEKHIKMSANDVIVPNKDTKISRGMNVRLYRNGTQTVTVDEDIQFETEQIKDVNRDKGYKEIQTKGVNGKRTVTYEINVQNGVEVSRREINSNVIQQPVKQVEIIGAKTSATFNGSFAEALARLRSCEGSYTSDTGNGYYGAYQFDKSTWGNFGGYNNPAQAPADVQDQKAWETYKRRGWQPWPSCKIKMGLQDIYR
ncbi:MAG: G5 domain-containing protein [Candidatus Saccharimonas sp.]